MKKIPTPPVLQDITHCFDWLDRQNLIPDEPLIDSPPAPEFVLNDRTVISFSSNNYLGLSRRPEVIEAASQALHRFTMGTCESRRLGGNIALLEALEERLARFKGVESAMIFATGLLANVAVIPGLMDAQWYCNRFYGRPWSEEVGTLFSDTLNHRSIQMGIRLSHASCLKYRHGDMAHLEMLLAGCQTDRKMIVTDGIFSMDGDLAPLPEITALAKTYQAAVMVDDAHGTGIFGQHGRGVADHFGVEDQIDIHMGTLSKAVGAMGGFIATDSKTVAFLKSTASGYRFTSSLPAEQAAGILCAIDIMEQEPQLRQQLWDNVAYLLKGLHERQIPYPNRWSPIIPLFLGSAEKAFRAEQLLLKRGLSCIAIIPPLVQNNRSRLRITLNATHTSNHIDRLLEGLEEIEKTMGFQPNGEPPHTWQQVQSMAPAYISIMQSKVT
ncbi:MAG: pyridoxal phosphate-dependent aminotransferase family protein [Magnetococcales bacterium]|nr:pyridoxal phosphate-dependent aminotransferase family protein [Magnetococcales bacterium]